MEFDLHRRRQAGAAAVAAAERGVHARHRRFLRDDGDSSPEGPGVRRRRCTHVAGHDRDQRNARQGALAGRERDRQASQAGMARRTRVPGAKWSASSPTSSSTGVASDTPLQVYLPLTQESSTVPDRRGANSGRPDVDRAGARGRRRETSTRTCRCSRPRTMDQVLETSIAQQRMSLIVMVDLRGRRADAGVGRACTA